MAARFEWLVPGLLKEKLTALIKSLPKQLRVNFVPAADFVQQAFEKLKPEGSLYDALAQGRPTTWMTPHEPPSRGRRGQRRKA